MTSIEIPALSLIRSLHREHSEIKNWIFGFKILVLVLILSIAVYFSLSELVISRIAGGFFLGLMFTHMLELQHQCLHYTAVTSRALNRVLGFILGVPMLVSFEHYRQQHLFHHKHCGTKHDKEFFPHRSFDKRLTPFQFFAAAFSMKRLFNVLRNFATAWKAEQTCQRGFGTNHQVIRIEYKILSLFLVGFIGVLLLISRPDLILTIWILPMLLISEPLHFLVEAPEHHDCDQSSRNPFKNTRTIRGSRFSFWFTNGNNYHVEHHLLPGVPIDRLPKVHKEISKNIENTNVSYLEFFAPSFVTRPSDHALPSSVSRRARL